MNTPKKTISSSAPHADSNISPTRQWLTHKLCTAFLSDGISAEVCGQHVEIETDEAGPVLLLVSEDSSELSVWTSIPLKTPQSSADRLRVLNAINAESMGARFYQVEGEDDDVIDVTENRLIGGEGLNARTAIQFVTRFAFDVKRADELLSAAGVFDDPDNLADSGALGSVGTRPNPSCTPLSTRLKHKGQSR
jgi:Putative bacterial sensory transduction regulator